MTRPDQIVAARLSVRMELERATLVGERLEPDLWEADLDQFIAENGFEGEEETALRGLEVGFCLTYGGGAAPLFTVTRTA